MAQITSATLRGEVKNQSDERLVGATIVLSHAVTGRSYAVVADDKGYYSLHGIRPDDGYMLEISFVGYKPYLRQDIVMRVGEEVVEDVVLVESTEIEAVVVTATPHQEAEVRFLFFRNGRLCLARRVYRRCLLSRVRYMMW